MKTHLHRSLPLIAALALAFSIAPSAAAQTRHRIVKRPPAAGATVAGRVTDATTGAAIGDASVHIGSSVAVTGADGSYSLAGLAAQSYGLEVTHWRYRTESRQITLSAGANQIDIALQPATKATVRMKNGSTVDLVAQSVKFGYVVAFVGWRSGPELRLCLPSGQETTIQTADMKSVEIVGSRTESTACCSLAPGTAVRVTRRSGEVVDATIRESCTGLDFFVTGRNAASSIDEALRLLDATSVTFE